MRIVTFKSMNTAIGQFILILISFMVMLEGGAFSPVVLATFAMLLCVSIIRLRWGIIAHYRPAQLKTNRAGFVTTVALAGLGWGLLCAEAFILNGLYSEPSIAICTILTGALAAATYSLSPGVLSSRSFITCAIVPPVLTLLFVLPTPHFPLVLVYLTYWTFLMSQIQIQARTFWLARYQADHLKALEEHTLEAIVIHDEGRILTTNSAFLRMFNYSRAEVVDLKCSRLIDAEDRDTEDDWHILAKDRPVLWRAVANGGQLFYVESTARFMFYHGRKVRVACISDASARHEAVKAIRESSQQIKETMQLRASAAVEANRMKADFLANMSHEIRTPLNAIIGLTDLLESDSLNEVQRRYIAAMRTSGMLLLSIVNDVLDFSKIEAGKIELENLPFSVASVIEAQGELMHHRALAKGLTLTTLIQPSLPAIVKGDPGRIAQILVNLLTNAIKFTETGSIAIRVFAHVAKPGFVTFKVEDTGIGISDETLAKLFQPFTQADTSTARKFGGTGLGLTISRRLVDAMGGELLVQSNPGHGSEFSFWIPLERLTDKSVADVYFKTLDLRAKVLLLESDDRSYEAMSTYLAYWKMNFERIQWFDLDARIAEYFGQSPIYLCVGAQNVDAALVKKITEQRAQAGIKVVVVGTPTVEVTTDAQIIKPMRQSEFYVALASFDPKYVPVKELPAPKVPTIRPEAQGRILLAEDNLTNQMIAVSMLKSLGFEVTVAVNGAEALAAYAKDIYDLVLMDCQMPEMDGFEATKRIRELEPSLGRRTPIVALTANATTRDQQRCREAGMDDYISKPVHREKVSTVVFKWVNEKILARPDGSDSPNT